ncbi:MAG: hypothetical protein HY074_07865 [Deltaproteobacteria bacterium]|nr:hypothetical protein [Deltaproteobacteria bacterium]
MPILNVEIVGCLSGASEERLAQRLADAAGEVLQSARQGTWVKVRFLSPEDYAENGGAPAGVMPIFVRVLQRVLPPSDHLAAQTKALAKAIAEASGRPPENIHVIYEPPGKGRVAFGGTLVE